MQRLIPVFNIVVTIFRTRLEFSFLKKVKFWGFLGSLSIFQSLTIQVFLLMQVRPPERSVSSPLRPWFCSKEPTFRALGCLTQNAKTFHDNILFGSRRLTPHHAAAVQFNVKRQRSASFSNFSVCCRQERGFQKLKGKHNQSGTGKRKWRASRLKQNQLQQQLVRSESGVVIPGGPSFLLSSGPSSRALRTRSR